VCSDFRVGFEVWVAGLGFGVWGEDRCAGVRHDEQLRGGGGLGQRVHSLGGGVAPLVVLEYATLNTCGEGLGLVHNSRGGV